MKLMTPEHDDLFRALTDCLHAWRRDLGLPDGAPVGREPPRPIVDRLAAALAADPRTSGLEGLSSQAFGFGGGCLSFGECAGALLRRIAAGRDPREVYDGLLDILATGRTTAIFVTSLAGLRCETSVDLTEKMSLRPPAAVPESGSTTSIFYPLKDPDQLFRLRPSLLPPPEAALVIEEPAVAVRECSSVEFGGNSSFQEAQAMLRAALKALLLASGQAPMLRDQYVVFPDPGWPSESSNGWSSTETAPHPAKASRELNSDELPRLYDFVSRGGMAEELDLAMEKLAQSRRIQRVEDRVVDLGTCLEMMMMHGQREQNTEITSKVSHRAAWLLGRTFEERKRVFDTARDLYADRSAAVHTGRLGKPKAPRSSEPPFVDLSAYDELCRSLLVTLLEREGWPEWMALTLGGPEAGARQLNTSG